MRIGGIASGMDTEQMIRDMMRMERQRVDRLYQQEQRLKWKQEAYNDINRSMANFIVNSRKSFGLTRTTSTGTMVPGSVDSFNWVKKATSNDESVVKATANANAMAGTHKVEVEQLAEVASVTADLEGLLNADGTFKEHYGPLTIKAGNVETTFDIGGEIKTIHELVRAINGAEGINSSGKEVSLGLRASYDAGLGKMMITTKETGKDKSIQIYTKDEEGKPQLDENGNASISDDSFLKSMFAGDNAKVFEKPNAESEPPKGIVGKNAKIKFNGTDVEKTTNNFTIFGVNLQLQSKQVTGAEPIIIHVDTDVNGIFDQVTNFVNEYNKIIDEINGQVNQNRYRNFSPLTQEEKKSMSEKDIELWEEKSKSGLLKGDSALTRTTQRMRTDLYRPVEGVSGSYNHITQIGITTGSYQNGGKLVIDEQKLREAISNDPDGVMDLLFKAPAEGSTGSDAGLVHRIYDNMMEGMENIIRQSGPGEDASLLRSVRSNILVDFVTEQSSISRLDRDLNNLNSRIAREEDILRRREERYWQQFTAMEKALSQMNNQSAWLMSQMGMGQQY